MGIGVQSMTKRLPIVIGPIVGGLLIDRYGLLGGIRIGLAISIVFVLVPDPAPQSLAGGEVLREGARPVAEERPRPPANGPV